jgi:hypothetical protein
MQLTDPVNASKARFASFPYTVPTGSEGAAVLAPPSTSSHQHALRKDLSRRDIRTDECALHGAHQRVSGTCQGIEPRQAKWLETPAPEHRKDAEERFASPTPKYVSRQPQILSLITIADTRK